MLERSRLHSKKISKTQAVTSQVPHEMRDADVHIGPSDYVPFLADRKHALVRLEGRGFGDVPVHRSTNSKSGIRPTRRGSSSTPSGRARSRWIAASVVQC